MKHPLISALRRLFANKHVSRDFSIQADIPVQTVGKWEADSSLPDITPLPCTELQVWAHLPIYDRHSSSKRS